MARIRSIKPEFWKTSQEPWGFARENLYLLQEGDDGPIKVGIAAHPVRRMNMLQCGNSRRLRLVAVWSGSSKACGEIERVVLRYFSPVAGEWVQAKAGEIIRLVNSLAEDSE